MTDALIVSDGQGAAAMWSQSVTTSNPSGPTRSQIATTSRANCLRSQFVTSNA
jgi:hypothetical protein